MSTVVNTIKSVEFNIQVRYYVEDDEIIQVFSFLSKKYFRYIYDSRYSLQEKLEEMVKKNLLSDRLDNVCFNSRLNCEDRVEMRYKFDGEIMWSELKGFFATLHVFFPPNSGCSYCIRAEKKGEFIFCPEKNKTFPIPIKRCAVFKQRKDLMLT